MKNAKITLKIERKGANISKKAIFSLLFMNY